MKATIIGATGLIGRHLCDTYVGRGDSVTALVRDPRAAEDLARKRVSVVTGDLMDEDAICRACSNADVVFNLAGVLGRWGIPAAELELVNGWAAGQVVRCAARAGAAKVVHTSTAGVSGPLPKDICVSEDYPPSPTTEYQRTKLGGEQAALQAHRAVGMPLVIVRPAFVYGPGDMHKLPLFRAVAAGRMVLVDGGVSRVHPIFVDDVVSGMIAASEYGPGGGETYILAGGAPVAIRKLLATIAWALAVPAPRFSLPGTVMLALARAAETVCRLGNKEPPLTCSRVKLLSEHYAYSIEKARSELGFKPMVDLPGGMKRTVEWYLGRGLIRSQRHRETC